MLDIQQCVLARINKYLDSRTELGFSLKMFYFKIWKRTKYFLENMPHQTLSTSFNYMSSAEGKSLTIFDFESTQNHMRKREFDIHSVNDPASSKGFMITVKRQPFPFSVCAKIPSTERQAFYDGLIIQMPGARLMCRICWEAQYPVIALLGLWHHLHSSVLAPISK